MVNETIATGLGTFSKEKFNALTAVREAALDALISELKNGYREVTTSSLVNIAGSCENPNASFSVNYYGRDAHLSQSAQLQLEALVMRLNRGFFTVNNSFREEHFDDPEAAGRRLSEFTLIESERPWDQVDAEDALIIFRQEQEGVVKASIKRLLKECPNEIRTLGGNIRSLNDITYSRFQRVSYGDALSILKKDGIDISLGDDLEIREERAILRYFNNVPTFVSYHPARLKFFNAKRTHEGLAYSADLLVPKLGEMIGGAVREEDGNKVREYLRASNVGKYLTERGRDPEEVFGEYLRIFDQETPIQRGGCGIGFERFVAFLIGSNDILETISYRTLQPTSQ